MAVVGGAAVLFAVGPSNLWFFRWPMRLMPYVYLPVLVALAIVLGAGFLDDRRRLRAGLSAVAVLIPAYLAATDAPVDVAWHGVGTVVVAILTAAVIAVAHRYRAALCPMLIATTLLVLAVQLAWKPLNVSVRNYLAPQSAATFVDRFSDRYDGRLVQIASFDAVGRSERDADVAYQDLAFASMHAISGVEALSTYSGIGFSSHDAALCLRFDGATCKGSWDRLWEAPGDEGPVLADLIGADAVVVQRSLLETAAEEPPPGWS